MRFNTLSVLMQLSLSCPDKYRKAILSHKPVRDWMRRSDRAGKEEHTGSEGTSSLFYYLFEDYGAGAPILRQAREILDEQACRLTAMKDMTMRRLTESYHRPL